LQREVLENVTWGHEASHFAAHAWDGELDAISKPIGYAKSRSRSHNVVIRVYDAAQYN
jgi:hypothetical protein